MLVPGQAAAVLRLCLAWAEAGDTRSSGTAGCWCLPAHFPGLRPSGAPERGAAQLGCVLTETYSTEVVQSHLPFIPRQKKKKNNLDASLSAAYCLGFLSTTKYSFGFGQRSLRPHDTSSPEHFFLQATEFPYIQRVKASPPHLHIPTNPILSNHHAQTYW